MENSINNIGKIKELLTCPICHEALVNPVNLEPCHHIFCSYCLFNSKRTSCPLCSSHINTIHACSKIFMNNITELIFEEEYKDTFNYKLRCQYEKSLRDQIMNSINQNQRENIQQVAPDINVAIRQQLNNGAIIQYQQQMHPNRVYQVQKGLTYVIIGLFLIFIGLLLFNAFNLNKISSKLDL
jgi:hypothetical protein